MTRLLSVALVLSLSVACGRTTAPTTGEPTLELEDEAPLFPDPEDDGAWEEVDPDELALEAEEPVEIEPVDVEIEPVDPDVMDEAPEQALDTAVRSQ